MPIAVSLLTNAHYLSPMASPIATFNTLLTSHLHKSTQTPLKTLLKVPLHYKFLFTNPPETLFCVIPRLLILPDPGPPGRAPSEQLLGLRLLSAINPANPPGPLTELAALSHLLDGEQIGKEVRVGGKGKGCFTTVYSSWSAALDEVRRLQTSHAESGKTNTKDHGQDVRPGKATSPTSSPTTDPDANANLTDSTTTSTTANNLDLDIVLIDAIDITSDKLYSVPKLIEYFIDHSNPQVRKYISSLNLPWTTPTPTHTHSLLWHATIPQDRILVTIPASSPSPSTSPFTISILRGKGRLLLPTPLATEISAQDGDLDIQRLRDWIEKQRRPWFGEGWDVAERQVIRALYTEVWGLPGGWGVGRTPA
jgi:hypothetical protein